MIVRIGYVQKITHSRIAARRERLLGKERRIVRARWEKSARGKSGQDAALAMMNTWILGLADFAPTRGAARILRLKTAIKPILKRTAPRRTRHTTRSSAKSGDSNTDDAEPDRPLLCGYLYTEQTLADLLCISKKTLQNLYSKTPWLLPVAIQIPGARGPRWTPQAVQEWLAERPQHTPKPAPVAPRRKAGRPRIALAGKGGAS